MIRHYCDGCGRELTAPVDLTRKLEFSVPADNEGGLANSWPHKPLTVSTLRAVDGGWNAGDVCLECIMRVIAKGLDNAKATS